MNTSHIKFANVIMDIIIYVPLITAAIFVLVRFYHYIFPAKKGPKLPKHHSHPSALWAWVKKIFFELLIKFFSIMILIKDFIQYNYFRLGTLILFFIYLGVSYYYTFAGGKTGFKKGVWLYVFDAIWVLLGLYLSLSTFNVFLKNWRQRHPYPEAGTTSDRFKWTFWRNFFELKLILILSIVLALLLLVFALIIKYRAIALSLSVLVEVLSLVACLFLMYKWLKDHPRVKRALEDNLYIKILYHIIFLIPCFILTSADKMYKDIKDTPEIVYIVFAAELVVIFLYFVMPLITQYFYTSNIHPRNLELTKWQAERGLFAGENSLLRSITALKAGLDVDWDQILKNQLYKPEQADILNDFLQENGFNNEKEKKNSFTKWLMGKKISADAARSYIQANGPIIENKSIEVKELEHHREHISKEIDRTFTSKLLLKGPVYTDKQISVAKYEELMSQNDDVYNYRYGISAWVFLHEQPPSGRAANNEFTSLINYGNRPNILFKASENILQINMNDGVDNEKVIYKTSSLPLQQWSNIVVNYDGGTIDIFINGKLVSSVNNIVPFMAYENVTVGSDHGVSGGACSVVYFSSPLSKRQIEIFYNTLKNKNPPLV